MCEHICNIYWIRLHLFLFVFNTKIVHNNTFWNYAWSHSIIFLVFDVHLAQYGNSCTTTSTRVAYFLKGSTARTATLTITIAPSSAETFDIPTTSTGFTLSTLWLVISRLQNRFVCKPEYSSPEQGRSITCKVIQ